MPNNNNSENAVGPNVLVSGDRVIFQRTSQYDYPSWCVDGLSGVFLQENRGSPPAQCCWDVCDGTETYWMEWEDLRYDKGEVNEEEAEQEEEEKKEPEVLFMPN